LKITDFVRFGMRQNTGCCPWLQHELPPSHIIAPALKPFNRGIVVDTEMSGNANHTAITRCNIDCFDFSLDVFWAKLQNEYSMR
jgi:hypothetical protein